MNEVVIGLPDKDKFNASEPKDDAQFAQYVTHPSLPVLIQALFGVAPPAAPRNDLVAVFLTGIPGLNKPANVSAAEILRLNTSIAPTPEATQNRLGVIGDDQPASRTAAALVTTSWTSRCGSSRASCRAPNPWRVPGADRRRLHRCDGRLQPRGNGVVDPSFRLFRHSFPYLRLPLSGRRTRPTSSGLPACALRPGSRKASQAQGRTLKLSLDLLVLSEALKPSP